MYMEETPHYRGLIKASILGLANYVTNIEVVVTLPWTCYIDGMTNLDALIVANVSSAWSLCTDPWCEHLVLR